MIDVIILWLDTQPTDIWTPEYQRGRLAERAATLAHLRKMKASLVPVVWLACPQCGAREPEEPEDSMERCACAYCGINTMKREKS